MVAGSVVPIARAIASPSSDLFSSHGLNLRLKLKYPLLPFPCHKFTSHVPRAAFTATPSSTISSLLFFAGSFNSNSTFNSDSNSKSKYHHSQTNCPGLGSDVPYFPHQESEKIEESEKSISHSSRYKEWDSLTAKFAGAANAPFLLLQLPQIILNARNLLAGNKYALFAVPWLGMLTGLLGNLSLLSYFAKKKETEAVLIQTLGVVSIYIVLVQLAMAEAMPLPHFVATSIVVASGLLLNFVNYFNFLPSKIWQLWEDFITIGGVAVLPQVMWSTFVPYIPNSILPGTIAFAVAVAAVVMARMGKLSRKGAQFVGSISGWTATLLFMWMPVAQMWTNFLDPNNIKGLSAFTMLLSMIGNGLMIPRALFIRDLMWFTGSTWASFMLGWANLLCMYCFNTIRREFFSAATLGLLLFLGMTLWKDTEAYGYSSPMRSLRELIFGA